MRAWTQGISLILLTFFMFGLGQFKKPQMVSFKQDKIYQPFVLQLSKLHLSDAILEKKTQEFKQNLNLSLAEYAKKHQVVIVEQKLVLAGALDISDEILKLMSKRVQK